MKHSWIPRGDVYFCPICCGRAGSETDDECVGERAPTVQPVDPNLVNAFAVGFNACKREALHWCREMFMADDNRDWQEACESCFEAIESEVVL